jgi:hypothetical protein
MHSVTTQTINSITVAEILVALIQLKHMCVNEKWLCSTAAAIVHEKVKDWFGRLVGFFLILLLIMNCAQTISSRQQRNIPFLNLTLHCKIKSWRDYARKLCKMF